MHVQPFLVYVACASTNGGQEMKIEFQRNTSANSCKICDDYK